MKKRAARPPKIAHPLDTALGARIRQVRESQNPRVTMQWVAQEVGCSVQQMQKYETGENRMTYSRVCEIAKALDMTIIELIGPVAPR